MLPQGKNNRDDSTQTRSLTGISWHKDKYVGVPLDLNDERLKAHADWLKKHDLTIVKIDSAERHEAEDVYVSISEKILSGPNVVKPNKLECSPRLNSHVKDRHSYFPGPSVAMKKVV